MERETNHYKVVGNKTYLTIEQRNGKRHKVVMDTDDLETVQRHQWHVATGRGSRVYLRATNKDRREDEDCWVYLHRLICDTPQGKETKCINGNSLDLRKCNWAYGDHAFVMLGTGHKNFPSNTGEPNIYQRKKDGLYCVQFSIGGVERRKGFSDWDEAKAYRDRRRREINAMIEKTVNDTKGNK